MTDKPRIAYIQFIYDIPSIGTYWSRDKHGDMWAIEERGAWIVFTQIIKGDLHRRRIPMTSVGCISEIEPGPEDKPKKAA